MTTPEPAGLPASPQRTRATEAAPLRHVCRPWCLTGEAQEPRIHAMDPSSPTPRSTQPRNPLHGVTLEQIITELEAHFGWAGLAERIALRCFSSDPSVASSLKFLRKTPWAREKVEGLYRFMRREQARGAVGGATSSTPARAPPSR